MQITFHTGEFSIDNFAGCNVRMIDANQSEDTIVKATRVALNNACDDSLPIVKPDIFSHSELALTAVRVWCKENETSVQIWNWVNGNTIVSTIDTDGRIYGEYPFNKNIELLMELM